MREHLEEKSNKRWSLILPGKKQTYRLKTEMDTEAHAYFNTYPGRHEENIPAWASVPI